MGSGGCCGIPGPEGGMVDGMAEGGAGSRNFLCFVPYGGALCDVAAGASSGAWGTGTFRERTKTAGQCDETRAAMEGSGAVLHGRGPRCVQERRISGDGIGFECADLGKRCCKQCCDYGRARRCQ